MILLIIISVLLVFLIPIFILSKKYNNPYKLYICVGKKGSGKSTLICKLAHKGVKKGYRVISNVVLPNLDYTYIDDPKQIAEIDFSISNHNLLLLDEGGIWFDSRDFKTFPKELTIFFKYMRKLQTECYIFSQSLDIDKKIRDLGDRLLLTKCFCGWLCYARWIDRQIVFTKASDFAGSTIADELHPACFIFPSSWIFTFVPKWCKLFDTKEMLITFRKGGSNEKSKK